MADKGSFFDLAPGLRGYLCMPATAGPHPAVLLYMEAFGINAYIQSECERLGRAGYVALAPDFFRGDTFEYGDWERIRPKIAALGDQGFLADIRAAVAHLDSLAAVQPKRYGCIGFCMGGRLAFLTAAELGEKIAAAVSFYGGGIAPEEPSMGRPILIDRTSSIRATLLLHYGAEDQGIAPAEHGRIAEKLSAAGIEFGMHVYPNAGHGFASVPRPDYRPETAEIAWAESLALFERTVR